MKRSYFACSLVLAKEYASVCLQGAAILMCSVDAESGKVGKCIRVACLCRYTCFEYCCHLVLSSSITSRLSSGKLQVTGCCVTPPLVFRCAWAPTPPLDCFISPVIGFGSVSNGSEINRLFGLTLNIVVIEIRHPIQESNPYAPVQALE